jgi:hypothetical protein
MFIADPVSGLFASWIQDSGVKKSADPGFATSVADPDPGWVKTQDPDPGRTTRIIVPRA